MQPSWIPLLLAGVVLSAVFLKISSKDTACYGTGRCSRHNPMCDRGNVFIIQALRGVKPRGSACAERTSTCPPDPASCCQPQDGDCMETYSASHFQQLYSQCWNEGRCSYTVPLHRSQSCGSGFQNLSSYSQIKYMCLTGSSITDFHWRTPVRGSGVAVAYSPHYSDQNGMLSCLVHSASCSRVSTNVLLYKESNSQCGSSLHFTTLHLNGDQSFNCSVDPDFTAVENVFTPFTISLEVDHLAPVDTAWVVVQGSETDVLSLTCGFPNDTAAWSPCPALDCFTKDRDGKGHYWGAKNTTVSGRSCQRWDQQTPHDHDYTERLFQERLGVPDLASQHNYCRDTERKGYLWCYTTDPNVRYENCSVMSCSEVPIPPSPPPSTSTVSVTTEETAPTPEETRLSSPRPSNSSEELAEDSHQTQNLSGGVIAAVVVTVVVVVVVATALVVMLVIYKGRRPVKKRTRETTVTFSPTYQLHPSSLFDSSTGPDSVNASPDEPGGTQGTVMSPPLCVEAPSDATSHPRMETGDNEVDYNHLGQRRTPGLVTDVTYGHLMGTDDGEYGYDLTNGKGGAPSSSDVTCNVYDVAQPAAPEASDIYVNYDGTGAGQEDHGARK